MEENKDYRKIIKDYYNINLESNYDIHHIDLNHNNNEISNLMIIPKELHQKYHKYLNAINYNDDIFIKTFDAHIHSNIFKGDNYNLEMINNFIPILIECNKWFDYKMYLEGKLPNIHNIIIKE